MSEEIEYDQERGERFIDLIYAAAKLPSKASENQHVILIAHYELLIQDLVSALKTLEMAKNNGSPDTIIDENQTLTKNLMAQVFKAKECAAKSLDELTAAYKDRLSTNIKRLNEIVLKLDGDVKSTTIVKRRKKQ